jgi:hypothetical protein
MAFWFKVIPPNNLPAPDSIVSLVGMGHHQKKVSLVKYTFLLENGEIGREKGICLTKETSSDKRWTLQSMLVADQVDMCWICAQHFARPVRHRTGVEPTCLVTQSETKTAELLGLNRAELPQPAFGRRLDDLTEKLDALPTDRSGPYATRRTPVGQFPCKMYCFGEGCQKIYYKQSWYSSCCYHNVFLLLFNMIV